VQSDDPVGEGGWVLGSNQDSGLEMGDLLRDPSDARRDDGQAGSHRLERTQWERLLSGREHEHAPAPEGLGHRGATYHRQGRTEGWRSSERVDRGIESSLTPEAVCTNVLKAQIGSSSKCENGSAEEDIRPFDPTDVTDCPHDEPVGLARSYRGCRDSVPDRDDRGIPRMLSQHVRDGIGHADKNVCDPRGPPNGERSFCARHGHLVSLDDHREVPSSGDGRLGNELQRVHVDDAGLHLPKPAVDAADVPRRLDEPVRDPGRREPPPETRGKRPGALRLQHRRPLTFGHERTRPREPPRETPAPAQQVFLDPKEREARAERLGLVEEDGDTSIVRDVGHAVRIDAEASAANMAPPRNSPTLGAGGPARSALGARPGRRVADPPRTSLSSVKSLKILITTSYYWPELAGSAPYLTGVAEYLSARGHRVVVATTFPHYPSWKSTAGGRLWRNTDHNGVRIKRRWAYVPGRQSAIQRALYEATLYAHGLTALPMRRRPDVVVGTCPSLAGGALGATASTFYRVPFALVFQDLMGLAARQSGVAGGGAVESIVRRAELALARRAGRVAVVAEGFRRYLETGGVDPKRIHRIRNWSRTTEPTESAERMREELGWSREEYVCLHAGNMGHKQGLQNVLDAAQALRDAPVRFVLAGDGNDKSALEASATARALANVEFLGPAPPGRWEAMLHAADLLLVNQRASVGDMSLPSKLTSYFAAGRPVVAAVATDSEAAREVEAAGAGRVVPPEDPSALSGAITDFRNDPEAAVAAGGRARRYATERLSHESSLANIEAFVVETANDPSR